MSAQMSRYRAKTSCVSPSTAPMGKHFGIIEFSSYYTPGDERSRTNPGHGYPAFSTDYSTYSWFTDEQAWKDEIAELIHRNKNFVPIIGQVPKIETTVQIKIDKEN